MASDGTGCVVLLTESNLRRWTEREREFNKTPADVALKSAIHPCYHAFNGIYSVEPGTDVAPGKLLDKDKKYRT